MQEYQSGDGMGVWIISAVLRFSLTSCFHFVSPTLMFCLLKMRLGFEQFQVDTPSHFLLHIGKSMNI